MICNLVLQTTCTIDFQHTCTCRKQLLLRGRARIGRAGASGPRASTSFWLLVRVVHLSLHENCVNACGVCKKALYPANLAWLISLSQDWWGLSLRSPQSFDYRRALVTNRPSLPSKYVVCGKLTLAIGRFGEHVHCPTTSDCKRALARNRHEMGSVQSHPSMHFCYLRLTVKWRFETHFRIGKVAMLR
jgi:hypothetical protein